MLSHQCKIDESFIKKFNLTIKMNPLSHIKDTDGRELEKKTEYLKTSLEKVESKLYALSTPIIPPTFTLQKVEGKTNAKSVKGSFNRQFKKSGICH